MDGTFGGNPDVACQPADQEIADFAGAPMRLVALGVDDEAFELLRKLIGIAHRSTRSIGEGFEPMLPIAVEDLVAGFTGDAELTADVRHRLPIERRLRLRNQSLQPALCRRSAEHRDERRLMCSGILPGCFADGGWVAFNVEEVVSNLECFAECGAITV